MGTRGGWLCAVQREKGNILSWGCQCPQSPWPQAKPSLLGLWSSPLLFTRRTHVALHSRRHGHTPAHTCTCTHARVLRLQYRWTAAILNRAVWGDTFDRPESWDAPGIFWVKVRMLLNFLHRTERPYHTEVFPPWETLASWWKYFWLTLFSKLECYSLTVKI